MARIERFEDIEAWKKGRALRKAIYDRTKTGAFAKDFALRDQIRRAAISVTSNIAEGFERGGNLLCRKDRMEEGECVRRDAGHGGRDARAPKTAALEQALRPDPSDSFYRATLNLEL